MSDFSPLGTVIATIHYRSPLQWLADQLACAIATLYPTGQDTPRFLALPSFSLDTKRFGTVASPLPLKLARPVQRSPQEIGAQLIQLITQPNVKARFAPDLWLHPEGWLYASFSDVELAQWLQTMVMANPILSCTQWELSNTALEISADPIFFQLQYAHARCCSLLNLAQQEGLIHLSHADLSIAQLLNPIPWHNRCNELRLQAQSEQRLLLALLQFPYTLSSQKQIYGDSHAASPGDRMQMRWPPPLSSQHRQAQQWSHLFLDFYRDCRVFGDLQSLEPELAQTRWALIMIQQRVLGFYLETVLQIEAPMSL